MNPPTEMPLVHLLRMVTLGMVALLALLFLCTPMETHRRTWEGIKREVRELIGPHALFFKSNLGLAAGLYVLGRLCLFLGGWFEWPVITDFGNNCKFFAMLSCLGFFWLLKSKAGAQENQKIGQALFGPRTLMKTDIGAIHNYGGNVAAGNSGPVHQQARVDAIAIHQQINSFLDKVAGEDGLETGRKREALTELNTLAEQAKLPPEKRETPRILTALKLLPGLLSSVNGLTQEWDKLEPWLRSHFGG